MTLFSGNGYVASPYPADIGIVPMTVAGVTFQVAGGDVLTVLQYVVEQVNARVEPLVSGGGYSFRANVNDPSSLSNHASGTAIDYNPEQHPNATTTTSTWTQTQIAEIELILAETSGAVRWGGDYNNTPDSMHFEINVGPVPLAAAARNLGLGGTGGGTGGTEGPQGLLADFSNSMDITTLTNVPVIQPFEIVLQDVPTDFATTAKALYWRLIPERSGLLRFSVLPVTADGHESSTGTVYAQFWGDYGNYGQGGGGNYSMGVFAGQPVIIAVRGGSGLTRLAFRVSDYAPQTTVQAATTATKVIGGVYNGSPQVPRDIPLGYSEGWGFSTLSRGAAFANSFLSQPSAQVKANELLSLERNDGYGSIAANAAGDARFHGGVHTNIGWAAFAYDATSFRVVHAELSASPNNFAPPNTYLSRPIGDAGAPQDWSWNSNMLQTNFDNTPRWVLHTFQPEIVYEITPAQNIQNLAWQVWKAPVWHDTFNTPGTNGYVNLYPWNTFAHAALPVGLVGLQDTLSSSSLDDALVSPATWDMVLGPTPDDKFRALQAWVTFDHEPPMGESMGIGNQSRDGGGNTLSESDGLPTDKLYNTIPLNPAGRLEVRLQAFARTAENNYTGRPIHVTAGNEPTFVKAGEMEVSEPPTWFRVPDDMLDMCTPGYNADSWPELVVETRPTAFDGTADFAVTAGANWTPVLKLQVAVPEYVTFDTYTPTLPPLPPDVSPPTPPPVAAFTWTPDDTGWIYSFDASASTGDIVTYEWDWADPLEATFPQPTQGVKADHFYRVAPETYTVTLTVTDYTGATSTVSHDVPVEGGRIIGDYLGSGRAFAD